MCISSSKHNVTEDVHYQISLRISHVASTDRQGQGPHPPVNGAPVGQTTLSTYASGTVGLRCINDGEVTFQQLSIAPV